jgi:hypothetical protein
MSWSLLEGGLVKDQTRSLVSDMNDLWMGVVLYVNGIEHNLWRRYGLLKVWFLEKSYYVFYFCLFVISIMKFSWNFQ